MKRHIHTLLAFLCIVFTSQVNAQSSSRFDNDFEAIDKELQSWDPIRGKWLGSSMRAMSAGQPIPDRTFPEDFSPGEMIRVVPSSTMSNIRVITAANGQNSTDLNDRERWNRMNTYVSRPNCDLVMGRTYGDPHLKSFDGESYSFQTVGEFVLASANNGQLEVQVRQEPQRDDFSLNTAVAMQVGGDRVGIYANDRNNSSFSSPVLLNGFPLRLSGSTYYLPHGGTIRQSGKNYTVTWPTGEKVSVDMRNSGSMSFMNIAVQIYPCASNNYAGLLGNANGVRKDDYNMGATSMAGVFGGNNQMEEQRKAFLAKDFANYFRITQANSLFDYGFGQSTMAFTDYSYPRVHRSINDLPTGARTTARTNCERAGLRGAELEACMFDNGYLQIAPSPRPVIEDRTTKPLGRIEREVPNVNPPREIETPDQGNGRITPTTRPISTPSNEVEDMGTTRTNPTWNSTAPREVPTQTVSSSRTDNNSNNGAIPRPTSEGKTSPQVETEATERSVPAPVSIPAPTPASTGTNVEKEATERSVPVPVPAPVSTPVSTPAPAAPAPASTSTSRSAGRG